MKMFDSVKEVMHQACEEEGTTPIQEIIAAVGVTALIPMLWITLYMLGAR